MGEDALSPKVAVMRTKVLDEVLAKSKPPAKGRYVKSKVQQLAVKRQDVMS
jgi:hypothetical protein